METFSPTIWNVLHDGSIDRVAGTVPGRVSLYVGIEYLRERIPDDGEYIIVTLDECKSLVYRPYNSTIEMTDLTTIGGKSLTILNAEMEKSTCRVFTDLGILEIQFDGGSLSLDSGRIISLRDLLAVADAYWTAWKSKSNDKA